MNAGRRGSVLALLLVLFSALGAEGAMSFHDLKAKSIDGKEVSFNQYKGKVVLVVNTASQCGYTPQYAGLEKVYAQYKDQGLVVLGFPSNDFGAQEPGSNQDIKLFCQKNYKVTFPLFEKSTVLGAKKNPVYKHLLAEAPEKQDIEWNFTKFLVDRKGQVVKRFPSGVAPDSAEMKAELERLLAGS